VRVGLDQRDAPLDDLAVVGGPVRGNFRDWRGAVPLEPSGFELAFCHLARHDNLEGALTKLDCWWIWMLWRVGREAIQPIAPPV
jgi:hypothetical protein